jgi:AsmA protein
MKKTLIILGAVLITLIAAALIIPFLVPVERYKSEISAQVKAATGRDFTIAGNLSFKLFPSIALTAENVFLANVPASAEPRMASLDKVFISLRFLPLLSGQFVVDGFELVHPIIHLEVDKAGQPNWQFASAKKTTEEGKKKPAGTDMLRDLTLGDVRLSDGEVSYLDAKTGKLTEAKAINATLSLPRFDGPLKLDGSLVWNKEKVNLNFETANLKSLMGGQTVAVTAKVNSAPVNFSLAGKATKGEVLNLDGDVNVDAPSVRKLAAWASKPLTLPGSGLGPLSIAGHLTKAGNHLTFSKASIRLDNIRAKGTLEVTTGGPRVKAGGKLDTEDLDLNPYLPPVTEKSTKEWSVKPIDMSGLKAADLSFDFKTRSLKYRKITIGPSSLDLNLDNGKLSANLKEMSLYGGRGKGQISVDGSRAVPDISASFDLAGVNAEPLLMDAGGYNRLTGTLKTSFNIKTHGNNQQDMLSALSGNGAFQFADGTLKGVDLAAIAETIEKISNGVQAGGANMLQSLVSGDLLGSLKAVATMFGGKGEVDKTTKFTSLNATWKASGGTLSNDDLLLIGPLVKQRALFKMTGKGEVMLPPQEINYEAEIRSFAKTESGTGIGGKVRLTGPLADPAPCVVLGSLCIGKKTKPGDLLKMKLKGMLPGLGDSGSEPDKAPASPADKLKDIFKGITP